MPAGYSVVNLSDVALAAGVAKTLLLIQTDTAEDEIARLCEFGVSFDGTSGTAEPVVVELCLSDQTSLGTFTIFTPVQFRGRTRPARSQSFVAYTAEPGVLTVVKTWLVHPQTGISLQFPLGREPETTAAGTAEGLCIRCTAPAGVNARGYMEWEEG